MSKLKRILYFLPAAIWYGLIWSLSGQPADISTAVSNGVTGNMMSVGDALAGTSPASGGAPAPSIPAAAGSPIPSGGGSAYSVADETIQRAVQELLSFFIRKGAHMFLFFVLAILIWYAMAALIKKRPLRTLSTILPCAALASLDEFHQTLVPGRSGEVRDVMVDLTGVLIALLLFALPAVWLWLCRKLSHPERLWIIGAGCGAALLVYVGLLTGLAPLFVPRISNSPFLTAMPKDERAAVVSSAAPILRQLLYLLASAVTGFLSMFLAALSDDRRATITAFATVCVLSLLSGMIWALPAFAGVVLCLTGCGAAMILRKAFPLLSK